MTPTLRALLLALLLATLPLAPGHAAARQQDSVTLDVRSGYDGAGQYHAGYWFPVTIVAANSGGDLRGVIEWRFPQGDQSPTFRYAIDLPRGARKQIVLPVVTNESLRTAELRLLVDGAPLAGQNVRLNPINSDQLAIGVISGDQTLLSSLATLQLAPGYGTVISRMRPELLPSDAAMLDGLDAIVIHDLDTATLLPGQRGAIERWTRTGGRLLVGGGPNAERTARGLADLLPVDVGGLRTDVPVASLEALARRSSLAVVSPTLTASAVTLRPGAEALDTADLISARNLGAGQVIFTAFDPAALRAWADEPRLWERVLTREDRMLLGYSLRSRGENLLRDALQLGALGLPSPGVLLLLILIYIVVIGPVNFLLLRRMRRIDLAWITTPALVAVFLAAAYGSSFLLRGTSPQISQLALVQGFEGDPGGQATSFVGVFSPQRRSYNLSFGPEALVAPGSFEQFQFNPTAVTLSDSAASVPDLLIDVSSLRTLIVEQPVAEAPQLQSQLARAAGRVQGTLRNASAITLREALLVSGASAQAVGDLSPGASAAVDLELGLEIFPNQVDVSSEGLINRQQILSALFNYDRFSLGGQNFQGGQGLPDPDGVYLLAWGDQPAVTVSIDGDAGVQRGQTLYLIRLDV